MNTYITTQHTPDGCMVVALDDPSGSTNRTTGQFKLELTELLTGFEKMQPAERPRGLIIISRKPSFGVGGDVDQIAALAAAGAAASAADSAAIKALFRRLETLGLPVVACIAGTAVGGGFELALACHARFCLDDDNIRLGFPEVTLGLIPGAGGVVRSVHLLGLDRAIPLLSDGELRTPQQALSLGLLDGLADSMEAMMCAAQAWIAANPAPCQPWDRKRHSIPGGGLFASPARYIGLQTRTVASLQNGGGKSRARATTLGCITAISASGFADGEIIESRAFARQATSDEARALVGLRIHDRRAVRRMSIQAPGEFVAALHGAFMQEADALAVEGAPRARILNGARHAGYDVDARLLDGAEPAATADTPDLATIGERLIHAQLAAALPFVVRSEPGSGPVFNLAAVDDAGFPAWTGGPLRLLETRGAACVSKALQATCVAGSQSSHQLTEPVQLQAIMNRAAGQPHTKLETA